MVSSNSKSGAHPFVLVKVGDTATPVAVTSCHDINPLDDSGAKKKGTPVIAPDIYQRAVGYMLTPEYPLPDSSKRMLVWHPTGSGKTLTIWEVLMPYVMQNDRARLAGLRAQFEKETAGLRARLERQKTQPKPTCVVPLPATFSPHLSPTKRPEKKKSEEDRPGQLILTDDGGLISDNQPPMPLSGGPAGR